MKKVTLLLSLTLAATAAYSGTVAWSGGSYNGDIKGVSLQEDWLLVLYKDAGDDNTGGWFNELQLDVADWSVTSVLGDTANDVVLDVSTYQATLNNPITTFYNFSKSVDVEDSVSIYTVLFNSIAVGSATHFIVSDTTPVDSGTGGTGSPVAYNIGTTFAGEWQAIPEPAVAGLICIFGGGMLMGRRIFSKS